MVIKKQEESPGTGMRKSESKFELKNLMASDFELDDSLMFIRKECPLMSKDLSNITVQASEDQRKINEPLTISKYNTNKVSSSEILNDTATDLDLGATMIPDKISSPIKNHRSKTGLSVMTGVGRGRGCSEHFHNSYKMTFNIPE